MIKSPCFHLFPTGGYSNENQRAVISSSGNFGIGVASPGSLLSLMAGGDYTSHSAGTIFSIASSSAGVATTTLLTVNSSGLLSLPLITNSVLTTNASGGVVATTSIGILYGGTGITSYTSGDILYANSNGDLSKLAKSSDGLVLKLSGGFPSWQTDISSGGGGGATAWSTSTNNMIIYPPVGNS